MKKYKILWSLFSTMLMTHFHSVDAAPPTVFVAGVDVAPTGKIFLNVIGN